MHFRRLGEFIIKVGFAYQPTLHTFKETVKVRLKHAFNNCCGGQPTDRLNDHEKVKGRSSLFPTPPGRMGEGGGVAESDE